MRGSTGDWWITITDERRGFFFFSRPLIYKMTRARDYYTDEGTIFFFFSSFPLNIINTFYTVSRVYL